MTGTFPDKLKIAKVKLLYKSGKTSEPINYRPISILPSFSKVFEKAAAVRLKKYLLTNNILTDAQHGFRPGFNTTTALFDACNYVYDALDNRKLVRGILLDISKAFDSVDHKLLQYKLDSLGIRGIVLQWFASYLSDRFQFVRNGSNVTNYLRVQSGVPQGSILGPILFTLFINDITSVVQNMKVITYADGTSIFISGESINDIFTRGNSMFAILCTWFTNNRLSINLSKTHYIVFGRCMNDYSNYSISHYGHIINRKDNLKFLGVIIDQRLSWLDHINYLVSILSRDIVLLNTASKLFPKTVLLSLYYAFFHSHLICGIEIWCGANMSVKEHLRLLQKRAIRIVCRAHF